MAVDLAAYEAAQQFLASRINYERTSRVPYGARRFKLDRMRDLLKRLGNPHHDLPIVHVAGTKGKGSTAAMIGTILSAAGLRTGVYTSPHLDTVEERISIDGRPCPAEALVQLVELVRPSAGVMDTRGSEGGPTYFELVTAMALCHFRLQGVQAAVLEVGLGGRLDSTNVCHPRVAAITSISFDHTAQLGNTLAAIAAEKAGIAKPGVPLVCGVLPDEPRQVIADVCRQRQAPRLQLGRDFHYQYRPPQPSSDGADRGRIDYWSTFAGEMRRCDGLVLGMLGKHQAHNAAVALAVVEVLQQQGWSIPASAVQRGLAEAVCPARVEVLARRPTIVLDAAHNVASIEALACTLRESFCPSPRWLVFGTSQDKDVLGMLTRLVPHFDHVVLTRCTGTPRGMPLDKLAEAAAAVSGPAAILAATPSDAWDVVARHATPGDLVCITGSFFLAAEMRREIQRRSPAPLAAVPGG